jgi:hypothetical protein
MVQRFQIRLILKYFSLSELTCIGRHLESTINTILFNCIFRAHPMIFLVHYNYIASERKVPAFKSVYLPTTMLIYSPIGRQLSGLYKINILFQA